jgi:hypothetical protein
MKKAFVMTTTMNGIKQKLTNLHMHPKREVVGCGMVATRDMNARIVIGTAKELVN